MKTMRSALVALASWLLAGSTALAETPGAPPAARPAGGASAADPMPLDRAVAADLVKVWGGKPDAYVSVDVHVKSTTDKPVTVDLAGRYLTPRSGRCQRLGLSHPVTPSDPEIRAAGGAPEGTVPITLQPGETKTVRMHSCCMDAGKPCPSNGDEFVLAPEPPPAPVETALRWWVVHPTAPQGFVNTAIWQANADLLANPWTEVAPPPTRPNDPPPRPVVHLPKGRRLCAYGGTAYMLTDGDLLRLDAEGVLSFVGSGVHQAIPQADGLIGVGLGAMGREVWRFAQTGEPPWSRKFVVEMEGLTPDDWPDLVPAAGGAYVLLLGDSVSCRSAAGGVKRLMSAGQGAVSMDVAPADAGRGRFVVVVHRAGTPGIGQVLGGSVSQADTFTVWDVDTAGGGKATERKTFWNAGDVAAGLAGVFALSHTGNLERLEGERFQRLGTHERFTRIVAVGLERIFLVGDGGRLAAYGIRDGKTTPLPVPPAVLAPRGLERSGLSIDPVTDDLLWIDGSQFKRLKLDSTGIETLR